MTNTPFGRLSFEQFENLCAEIASRSVHSDAVFKHGSPGQADRGVDIILKQSLSHHLIAVQCKNYRSYRPGDLAIAVSDFLRNIDYWRERHVSEFIICIATDPSTKSFVADYFRLKKELEVLGISFRVWTSLQLEALLSRHPEIKRKYFRDDAPLNWGSRDSGGKQSNWFTSLEKADSQAVHAIALSPLNPIATILRSASEAENASRFGHLIIEKWLTASNRSSRSGIDLFKALRNILAIDHLRKTWTLRRAIGKAFGNLASELKSEIESDVPLFIDRAASDVDYAIVLATAITDSPSAAKALGVHSIKTLEKFTSPELKWHLARAQSVFGAGLGEMYQKVSTDKFDSESNSWIRKKWLQSSVRTALQWGNAEKEIERSFSHFVARAETRSEIHFAGALSLWLKLNSDCSSAEKWAITQGAPRYSHGFPEWVERDIASKEPQSSAFDLAVSFDLRCIDLDSIGMGNRQQRFGSEGRYGVIRKDLLTILESWPTEFTAILIETLLEAGDEGIRWAVLKEIDTWIPNVSPSDGRMIICKGLQDESGWIVREVIEILGDNRAVTYDLDDRSTFAAALGAIDRATKQGWERTSLGSTRALRIVEALANE
jgi:hypothetical protein